MNRRGAQLQVPVTTPCPHCGKVLGFLPGAFGTHVKWCGRGPNFWERVDKDGPNGCWIWKGYCQRFGHGWLGKYGLAHRYAYELLVGPVPAGKCLLHSCDNPPCVNPAHLFVGDRVVNNADKVRKRRHAHGERNSHAILTEAQVQTIRAEYWYDTGRSNILELAAKYGVSHVTISAIIAGRTWKHLPHTPFKPRRQRTRLCGPLLHEGENRG
jgi:hypothetical protein